MDLAFKYSKLSQFLSNKGHIVIISTISMFNEIYKWNRKNMKNYFEIYLKVPIKELKNRDPKKIYSRYFNNEIKNVAGLDLEIDEPYKPDLLIEFPNQPYSDKIVELLEKNFLKLKMVKVIKSGDFSGLASNYSKYRPDYSKSVLDAIKGLIKKINQKLIL